MPRIDRMLFVVRVIAAVIFAVSLFVPYQISIISVVIVLLFHSFLLFAIGAGGMYYKSNDVAYYIMAWSILFIGFILYFLKLFGIVPANVFTRHGVSFGGFMQMLLFSAGFAVRIKKINLELFSVKKKIEKRTAFLENIIQKVRGVSQELMKISENQEVIGEKFIKMSQSQTVLTEEMAASYEQLYAASESINASANDQDDERRKVSGNIDALRHSQDEVQETN